MGQFTIYKDDYQDFTVISNRFIDMYMRDANDAQIKVYLYLIRMLGRQSGYQCVRNCGQVQPYGEGCNACFEILGEGTASFAGV